MEKKRSLQKWKTCTGNMLWSILIIHYKLQEMKLFYFQILTKDRLVWRRWRQPSAAYCIEHTTYNIDHAAYPFSFCSSTTVLRYCDLFQRSLYLRYLVMNTMAGYDIHISNFWRVLNLLATDFFFLNFSTPCI